LREGLHYLSDSGRIWYTQAGERLIREHFRPPAEEVILAAKATRKIEELAQWMLPPVPGTPLSENIVRVRRLAKNPRLVLCSDVNGKKVIVRCQTNNKFKIGMLVDLRSCQAVVREGFNADRPDIDPIYDLKIPLPRFPGVWGYSVLTGLRTGQRA
jgi:hypothetical protein